MMGNKRWKGWVVNAGVVGVARGQMLGELPAVVTGHMIFRPQGAGRNCVMSASMPKPTSALRSLNIFEQSRIFAFQLNGIQILVSRG
jgi:hypothetical protein